MNIALKKLRDRTTTSDDSQIIDTPFLSKYLLWLLLGLIPAIYVLLLNSNLSPFIDNARYISAARALLSGNGYSRIHSQIISPQTLYPPGYPLILAGLIYLFSLNIIVIKLVSMLATICALIVTYFLLIRHATFTAAASVTLLAGINPLLAFFATVELTEAPYLMLSVLALLFIEKSADDDSSSIYLLAAIAISVCAYYVKSAGIALLPGALFYYAYKKEYKKLLIFALVFIALISPWIIRSFTLDTGYNGTYLKQLMWKDPYNVSLGRANIFDFTGRAGLNLLQYATLGVFLFRDSFGAGQWLIGPAAAIALSLSALVSIGYFQKIKENFSVVEAYVLCYFGMQLLWPMLDIRFIHPILPFILFYLFIGARKVGHKLGGLLSKPLLATKLVSALVVVLMTISLSINMSMVLANTNKSGLDPEHAHFYEAIGWLKKHTAEDSYILSVKPEVVFVLSDRRAETYQHSYLSSDKHYFDFILDKRFDYIVLDAFNDSSKARRPLAQAINSNSQVFELVYASDQNKIKIYEVNKYRN